MSIKQIKLSHQHILVRTCIVCGIKDNKRKLIRIARTDAGVVVDPSGKMIGRGAYLCGQKNCWERAMNGNILNKALRISLTDADRERLRQSAPVQ
jgi:predicted RNA-binding protein YlxR (DUF448 family)